MTAGLLGRLPRVALIACAIGLVSATIAFAASSTLSSPAAPAPAPEVVAPEALVVPDVRKQAYVFAKGSLEQEGFAWRVEGSVPGYAANVVVSQTPAPGSRVVPDGAPIVVLRLSRNSSYEQEGTPENVAPYPGKTARLVGVTPKAKPEPAKAAAAAPKPKLVSSAKPAAKPATRKPAFTVAGAPKEPADEILLSARAKQLAAWVEANPQRSARNVNHWLYQHNWIVTGARFGWADGAEALRTLVAVDARVQKLWGIGAQSERVAHRALAAVEARSR
jgi:hypothetical protein